LRNDQQARIDMTSINSRWCRWMDAANTATQ